MPKAKPPSRARSTVAPKKVKKTSVAKRPASKIRSTRPKPSAKKSNARPKIEVTKLEVDMPEWRRDGNGVSPYMPLTKVAFTRAVKYMRNPNERVLKTKRVTLVIDYPVRNTFETIMTSSDGSFTRIGLVSAIADAYQRMYQEERDTSILPEESLSQRDPTCMLINRAPTNGKWGIWGHDLGDLLLHTIAYNVNENKIYLGVDS